MPNSKAPTLLPTNAHKAPIEGDGIPDASQNDMCPSCGAPFTALFCGTCGQKNDDLRRSVFSLLKEFLSNLVAYDSRVWRTWATLIGKPGKVARHFADGARTKYTPPVRSYICVSLALFLFLSIFQIDILQIKLDPSTPDTSGITLDIKDNPYDVQFKFLSHHDTAFRSSVPSDDIIDNLNVTTVNPQSHTAVSRARGILRNVLDNPSYLDGVVRTWFPRLIFIMVPIAILLGKLFLWGRRAMIYDHAVHALYIHCVAFMGLFIATIAGLALSKPLVFLALALFMIVYVPLSTKRMFGRGWFRTLLTSYGVMFLYALSVILVLALILVIQIG